MIFDLLPLMAELRDASDRQWRTDATPADKRRATVARKAVHAWLIANWPEFGRKVDAGWWAGPEHVGAELSPAIVGGLSLAYSSENLSSWDGGESSTSGIHAPVDVYQGTPIGGLIHDRSAEPYAVVSAPMLRIGDRADVPDVGPYPATLEDLGAWIEAAAADPSTMTGRELFPDDSPEHRAARLTVPLHGMCFVGFRVHFAYYHRHGASVGVRTAVDTVTWVAGPRKGEVERFTPRPFYAPEHQPSYPPAVSR